MNYWRYLNQKATPWVSGAVLAGGFVSACLLFFLVKFDARAEESFSRPMIVEQTSNLIDRRNS